MGFDVADDLGVDVEAAGDVDDALCGVGVGVYLHAVAHVEDFVHFFPVGAALVVNHTEEWRDGEEVVFDDVEVVDEVEDLGLRAAAAVYHAADGGTVLVEDAADDGGVGASGGEDHLAGIDPGDFGGVGEAAAAAVDYLGGQVVVEGHGIVLGVEFGEDIVSGGGEAVAAHATVVGSLVGGLTVGGEADDDVAGMDVGIVDNVGTAHACGDGGVDDDGAHEVADVGGLATGEVDADAEVAHLLQELFGAVDDGTDDFAGDEVLVASDGGGKEYVVDGTDAEEVVEVHDDGVDGNAFPDGEVAGFPPVEVGEGGLGAGPVGVHDVAVVGAATEDVGDDFAEGLREEAFVDVADGVVNVFFGGGDSAQVVFECVHEVDDFILMRVCFRQGSRRP